MYLAFNVLYTIMFLCLRYSLLNVGGSTGIYIFYYVQESHKDIFNSWSWDTTTLQKTLVKYPLLRAFSCTGIYKQGLTYQLVIIFYFFDPMQVAPLDLISSLLKLPKITGIVLFCHWNRWTTHRLKFLLTARLFFCHLTCKFGAISHCISLGFGFLFCLFWCC